MAPELHFVNFYRHALLEGAAAGFQETGELTLILEGAAGAYISPVFDGGSQDATYNRLVVDGTFDGAKLEVIVSTTNSLLEMLDGQEQDLAAYLAGPQATSADKMAALTALPHVRAVGTQDILLHALTGRYLWIGIAVYPVEDSVQLLNGISLELPRCTFTEYFPEIYQGNDFFQRYIAIFQSMYLDLERRVSEIPRMLDYMTTADEHVEYLAGWLGIDNGAGLYTSAQLRHIIANLDLFQGGKGTAYALPRILELMTGLTPQIVEFFQWDHLQLSPEVRALYRLLYGETCDDFCVIFNLMDTGGALPVEEKKLGQIVDAYSVVGARCRLIFLRPECRLDVHGYLDVNSVLATPEVAYMDASSLDHQNAVG